MDKLDYKKEYKDLYQPKTTPARVTVPRIGFIMVNGQGDPNQEGGAYQAAIEILYGLSFTIKMSYKGSRALPGYFEYVVPPLEGLWWQEGASPFDITDKRNFHWISLIRQPEFVDAQAFAWAQDEARRKKPHLAVEQARFGYFEEGLCVQCLHLGPYDDEPQTLQRLEQFMAAQGLQADYNSPAPEGMLRRHHEIYLGDPRKTAPAKRRTVLRIPVK